MTASQILIIAGGLLSALGAVLLGLFGAGLVGALEMLTWTAGQTSSTASGQVMPAFVGGALCLVGLAVAQIGVYQATSGAVVSLASRCAFLAVGAALVAGGALIVNGVGSAFAMLQVMAISDAVPQAAELHEAIMQVAPRISLGGWLLLGAPTVVILAMLLGVDSGRKPAPTPLMMIVPLLGVSLGAVLGVFTAIWAWTSMSEAQAMLGGKLPAKPAQIVGALDALLFAAFLLGATFVLVALPAAMSALAMTSEEDTETKPAE